MPRYRVTAPDGRTVVIEGDTPPTEADLDAVFAQLPPKQAAQPQQPQRGFDWLGLAQQGVQGQTFGLSDELGAAAAAAAATMRDDASFPEAYRDIRDTVRYQQNQFRQQNPALSTAANIAGGITTGFPALATKAGAAAAGGVGGYGFSEETGADLAQDTAIGSALGLAGQQIFQALSPIARGAWRRITGRGVNLVDDAGKVTDEAITAIEQRLKSLDIDPADVKAVTNEMGGSLTQNQSNRIQQAITQEMGDALTPEQLRRAQIFQRQGVRPLRANLTQATDDFRVVMEANKATNKISQAIAEQDEQLAAAVSSRIDDIAPASSNMIETNANISSVVDDVVLTQDRAVSEAYRQAREASQGERIVPMRNLFKALQQNKGREGISRGIPSALRQELKNKGVIADGKFDPKRLLSVDEAEEVRQMLNRSFERQNPQGNMLIAEFKDALDDDVAGAVGSDIFAPARAAKVAFQRMIERSRKNKFDRTGTGFLEKVIYNEIPEEKIVPRLLTARDDDFQKFRNFLLEDAGEAGVQAWQDIKGQVLRDALEAATSTQGKGEGGVAVFNSRLFRNKLKSLMSSKKYSGLFDAEERQMIRDIIDIGQLRVPQRLVAQGEGPTAFAVREVGREIAERIPGGRALLNWTEGRALSQAAERQLNPLQSTMEYYRGLRL